MSVLDENIGLIGRRHAPVTPAAPAPYISPAVQLSGGYVPDYNALITNDPSLIAFRGGEQSNLDAANAARQAAIRALAVQYGALPLSAKDAYGDFDPTTMDLAQHNHRARSESGGSAEPVFDGNPADAASAARTGYLFGCWRGQGRHREGELSGRAERLLADVLISGRVLLVLSPGGCH